MSDRNGKIFCTSIASLSHISKVPRHVVAHRIGDVHDRGTGLYGRLDNAHQKLLIGAAGILGIKLNIVNELASMFDGMDRSLNCPFLSHMELVAQVTGAHTQPCMDTGPLGRFERLCSHFDIPVDSARQAAYRASVARNLANLLYGAKVTRTRDGKARLENVHVHAHQLAGDEELFLGIHAGARRLLTVAQGGVKDCDFAAYMFLLIDRFMTDGFQERAKA